MRNLFTILVLTITTSLIAQTHEITKHDGKIMEVNFIKTENNLVYYTSAESSKEKKISLFAIYQLHEKAKKEAKTVSEKIELSGKADYTKVIVLKPSQTVGLQESGVITSFLGRTKKGRNQSIFFGSSRKKVKTKCSSQRISIYCNYFR